MDPVFVSSTTFLATLVDILASRTSDTPCIYIDIEGVNLGRHGTISIIQIYDSILNRVFLIHVHTLQYEALNTPGRSHSPASLKSIFESDNIKKVFFDVRHDSDALYNLYDISLRGVIDLQLMELATRTFSRSRLSGLAKCIEMDAPISQAQRAEFLATKERGLRMFAPEEGGRRDIFNERPMSKELIDYCSQDVRFLSLLYNLYDRKITPDWREMVYDETRKRVADSQKVLYNGEGPHMAISPWSM